MDALEAMDLSKDPRRSDGASAKVRGISVPGTFPNGPSMVIIVAIPWVILTQSNRDSRVEQDKVIACLGKHSVAKLIFAQVE